jgi:hypothetical protein
LYNLQQEKIKKVLILAYDFPPYVSVGGLRPYNWYKYLHEFDVYPIIVTRQWNNKHGNHLDYIEAGISNKSIVETSERGIIISTPYVPNFSNKLLLKHGDNKNRLLRKFITAWLELMQFIFIVGPKSHLYFAAHDYLKNNKVDCIIACADPFILFNYATKLSKKFKIPWIADYRDPWSQNFKSQKYYLLKVLSVFFEKKIVKTAEVITTVSEFLRLNISSLIKDKPFHILPNGFDPETIERTKNIEQDNKIMSIAFVGTIYPWYPLRSFLGVLTDFIIRNGKASVQLNFYGINIPEEVRGLINKEFTSIKDNVSINPKIPNGQLMEELSKNNVMLLFNSFFHMGTKVYDYLGIKRKVILCYSNDAEAIELKRKFYIIYKSSEKCYNLQEKLIAETKSGIIVKDSKELSHVLDDLYSEFKANGFIKCESINTENYSRKIQVEKLGALIHKLTDIK